MSTMNLAAIQRGRIEKPIRVLLYATEGIGKTTFAANAPSPIFLATEDGTEQLDVARFPRPQTWQDVLDALRALDGAHDYRTLVIDTIDWLEPLIWRHVCEVAKKATIEEVGGGYGKGYLAALDEWRVLLAGLERLRERGMHVVLLGHTLIKKFGNPDGDDYDRHVLKINDKAGALIKEWCDAVLFARYEVFAVKAHEKDRKAKGISTGARQLHSVGTAAYDAKNRYSLPAVLPLSWADFEEAVRAGRPADPAELAATIAANAARLPDDLRDKAAAGVKRANGDAVKLAQLDNWVNAQISAHTKED